MPELSGNAPCPYCASDHVVRNGTRKNSVLYRCRGCRKQFSSTMATHGHHFSPALIGTALELYFRGSSLQRVIQALSEEWSDFPLSKETVSRWVRVYSDVAAAYLANLKVATGNDWLVLGVARRVRGRACSMWVVADLDSGYILSCGLSGDGNDIADLVLHRAADRALGMPGNILLDSPQDGPALVRVAFPEANIVPLGEAVTCTYSEDLDYAIRHQAARLQSMKDVEHGCRYLQGWMVFHNHLGGSRGPDGTIPGEKSRGRPCLSTWLEVVEKGPRATHDDH